ncbi:putative ribonuclease H-like domain-containing protein [Tanacetum coccineum]
MLRPLQHLNQANAGKPQQDDTRFVDSGCSRHMTGNIAYLSDFKEFDGGYVTFGGGAHGGRISGKGTLKTDSLDFEDLPDESQILLKIPRKDNMYSFDMKNIVPKETLTCLVAKATSDESMLWHRRLGHINFKNINKLVKDNLVRGLPTKCFENDQTCVACLKGKQHRASCKSKDETSEILKNFIKEIENLVDKKVKIIRSDNGTEFKNKVMDDFCREKGIKREYSVARTPQQNGVAERRNRTLIEVARTMLADSKLPTTFWAEAVSTACYVQNRVLVVKPHNKTPYELFRGFKPALSFMRPFGCHVTILNTLDNLGKFDGKSDEGFFVGYSLSSKAFRVYNTRTRRVEENLHIGFLENKPMIEGNGPKWLFDIDSLTQSMNYVPVAAGTIINESAGTQGELNAGTSEEISQDAMVMPIYSDDDSSPKEVNAAGQHVNTASPDVTTGSFKLNVVGPSVNTASSYDQDSPKDMFTMGASHTLEATHVEFFSDEDEPEVDLGNITNSYTVPTTPNTRIHKDHPIENVIGDVKSTVQTRRMTKPTSEQGFLSAVWILVDLPFGKRAIGTKWVFRNKKDKRAIVIRNKEKSWYAHKVHRQEEVFQIDVKSAFLYGTIEEKRDYAGATQDKKSTTGGCYNVADLLTKGFDAGRFQYMVSSSGPRCQDTILGDVDAQTRFETTSKQSNDPPLSRGYTLRSGEDSMKLLELMELCTKLSKMLHKNRKSDLIHYALTINPTIYTSCIQQLWAISTAKTVNGVRQIQALIDKKKFIIMETSIRSDLHLEDAGAIDCLPTATIFEELARMSSTMASLIICLATNQRFNLSKYIFDAMVKHLDGGIYVNLSHTKKIFANMKREGKDFSGRITPLFEIMMVQPTQDEGVDSVTQEETQPDDSVPTPSNNRPLSGEDSMQLSELMLLCTNLQKQVLDFEKAKDAQAKEIADLKKRVQRLERKKKSRTTGLKRLKKVGMTRRVESSEDQESLGDHEDASKQGGEY